MAENYKETKAFLRKYGDSVEQEIEKRLTNNGKIASGKLYDSIRYEVKETKSEFIISFLMADYGDYVDKGVQGSESGKAGKGGKSKYKYRNLMPPETREFRSWLKLKGIPKEKSYVIRRSIWKFGITPTNFFTIPTTRRQKYFDEQVAIAMAKDIDKQIQDGINK